MQRSDGEIGMVIGIEILLVRGWVIDTTPRHRAIHRRRREDRFLSGLWNPRVKKQLPDEVPAGAIARVRAPRAEKRHAGFAGSS